MTAIELRVDDRVILVSAIAACAGYVLLQWHRSQFEWRRAPEAGADGNDAETTFEDPTNTEAAWVSRLLERHFACERGQDAPFADLPLIQVGLFACLSAGYCHRIFALHAGIALVPPFQDAFEPWRCVRGSALREPDHAHAGHRRGECSFWASARAHGREALRCTHRFYRWAPISQVGSALLLLASPARHSSHQTTALRLCMQHPDGCSSWYQHCC